MGFFKRFSKGGKDDAQGDHVLDHPRHLGIGDIVKFGFCDQAGLSNQEFLIKGIKTYDLNPRQEAVSAFCFTANQREYSLSTAPQHAGDTIAVEMRVFPEDVGSIFSLQQFGAIMDPDTGTTHVLQRENNPAEFEGWTSPRYLQEAFHEAYLHEGDYRGKSLPDEKESSIPFDYYYLISDQRRHAIRIEVFEGGKTDVYLIAYIPVRKIEEMWPK